MASYDAIVVGLGGMGSAALYHLAQRGCRVLGLDQFPIAHDRGSSHGATRIIRRAYFEHADYVPLVDRAYALWADLERQANRTLIFKTGLLLLGHSGGTVVPSVRQVAQTHQLDIQDVPLSELNRRFPGISAGDDMEALFEADAGYLAVEDCVRAHTDLAVQSGATLALDEPVTGWRATPSGVEVTTASQTYRADRLVLTPGPWSRDLLPNLSLEVRRKVVVWFRATSNAYEVDSGFPVFCVDSPDGFFYGFPATDTSGLKIGEHTGGDVVADAGQVERELHETDVSPLTRFVKAYLPEVDPTPRNHGVCMYTMTPDSHFIVDVHSDHPNVAFAVGFSGHGFKFAPVVGSVLADLLLNGNTDAPVRFLRASRKGLHPK